MQSDADFGQVRVLVEDIPLREVGPVQWKLGPGQRSDGTGHHAQSQDQTLEILPADPVQNQSRQLEVGRLLADLFGLFATWQSIFDRPTRIRGEQSHADRSGHADPACVDHHATASDPLHAQLLHLQFVRRMASTPLHAPQRPVASQ